MDIDRLVLKGFFPEEIIPPFVSEDLTNLLPKILPDIDLFDSLKKGKITKLLPYSIPKVKAYRRNISIPNPLSFVRLAKTVVDNWQEIVQNLSSQVIFHEKNNQKSSFFTKPHFSIFHKLLIINYLKKCSLWPFRHFILFSQRKILIYINLR